MKRLAILISGGGTTAEAVINAIQKHELTDLQPFVISSNKNAKGNKRVRDLGIKPLIIDKNSLSTQKEFDEKLFTAIEKLSVDIIALLGWLPLVPKTIVRKYKGQIFNQHGGPVDPGRADFGGYGMTNPYRFTAARIAYIWTSGDKPYTESTTHFVEEAFDMGDLIRTEKLLVPAKKERVTIRALRKDPKELVTATHLVAKKLNPLEHDNVIKTLQMFANGNAHGFKREEPLIPEKYVSYVDPAKKLAKELFPYKNL